MKNILLVVIALFFTHQLFSQSVKGRVIDEESNKGIPDAVVFLHELNTSTFTNEEGEFQFDAVRNGNYHLHISCIGYEGISLGLKVPMTDILLIPMKPTLLELSQAVIEDSFQKTGEDENSLSILQMGNEELEEKGLTSLSEALNTMPGVRSISVGSGIAKPVIRGVTGNRVLVNQQGIKQEGQQWGNDHGLEIDPNGVDRLELIKGPGSLWYGSDGLGGVINILPTPIPNRNTWNTTAKSYARSNDSSFGFSVAGGFRKESFFLNAHASLRDYGDYRVPADSFVYLTRVLPIIDSRLKNTAGRDQGASLELGKLGKRGYVRVKASHFRQRAGLFPGIFGIPGVESLQDDGNSRDVGSPAQQVEHNKLSLNLNRSFNSGWLEMDGAIQHNRRQELVNGSSGMLDALDLILLSYTLNGRFHFHNDAGTVIGFGSSHLDNRTGGFEFLIPEYQASNVGVFFTSRLRRSRGSTWNYGLRADIGNLNSSGYYQAILDDTGVEIGTEERSPEFDELFLNFSGALGWSKDLSERTHLKFNFGKSFRIPNAAELGSNGVHHGTFRHEKGDASLKAEHGYQLDGAFYFQEKKFLFRFTPYLNYFEGFIYLRPSAVFSELAEAGQVYQYTQHDAIYTGYEFLSDFHPREELHVELASEYVYSYNIVTGLALPFTPPLRNRISLSWEEEFKISSLGIGSEIIQVASQNRVDRNEDKTPGYFLWNAHLKYKIPGEKTGIQIILQVQNILDENYLDHLSRYRQLNLPAQGRNLNLQVIIPLNGETKSKSK